MIALSCAACQKPLKVKEGLAGKKVKCPGCGKLTVVPAHVAVTPGAIEEMRTLAPEGNDAPALPADPPTDPSLSKPDVTQEFGAATGSAAHLTDFLSPKQADDELGRLGKYRILAVLGHGGMGVVYKAEDPKLKRTVAVKAMLPTLAASASAGQRFLREAQTMAALEHDHIVRVYQVDEERGVPFLAMEFLKGEPLEERLKRDERLPLPEVLRIGREIAEGLAAAHAAGLIHRDIKPANIWLEAPKGRVKILDFGLARAASQEAGLTQQGAIIGTPAYMAPEQARGEPVDARSDVFSLGVVLYRLATGRQPFQARDTVSTLLAVATEQPAPPQEMNADLPRDFSDLVMRLLHKDRNKRPGTAAEVVQALQTLERGGGEAPQAAPARTGRRPLLVAALLVLGLLVGGGTLAVIRIQTAQGDFVLETDEPDFSFQVKQDQVFLHDQKSDDNYKLAIVRQDKANGEYELDVTNVKSDLSFRTKTLTIRRGEKVALKAWIEPRPAAAARQAPPAAGADDAFRKMLEALPREKQPEAVGARLKELNKDFKPEVEGNVNYEYVEGKGWSVQLKLHDIRDLSPVGALPGLWKLRLYGPPIKAEFKDLSPLKGTKLTYLACNKTKVADLTPLQGLKLVYLDCHSTDVTNLSPLKGMKLETLNITGTEVTDLSPLKDMKLTTLLCDFTPVTDLAPLRGMPLKVLKCNFNPRRDCALLRSLATLDKINDKPASEFLQEQCADVPAPADDFAAKLAALPKEKQVEAVAEKLQELNPRAKFEVTTGPGGKDKFVKSLTIKGKDVTDLAPVRALPRLELLKIEGTPVNTNSGPGKGRLTDLSPLRGMNLKSLYIAFNQVSDLSPLQGMSLTYLDCRNTRVTDLAPLKGMPLNTLYCHGNAVADLTPLQGMDLVTLDCTYTNVSDLSPLKGMKRLKALWISKTKVADLSPLRDLPLQDLHFTEFNPQRDTAILRSLPNLQSINGKSAKEFWQEVEQNK